MPQPHNAPRAPQPGPCRYCGQPRPFGYQVTCGQSACQQQAWEDSPAARLSQRTATQADLDAYRQGQRDREQGWPENASLWGFAGRAATAYHQGYGRPRA